MSEVTIDQRLDWTIEDNAKKAIQIADLTAERDRYREALERIAFDTRIVHKLFQGQGLEKWTGNEKEILWPMEIAREALNSGN